MSALLERTRRSLVFAAALSTLAVVGCGDDGTDPEPEPEIATIRVTVGTTTINIPFPNGPQPTAIPLRVNQANAVTFRFLGADGNDEPIIAAERAEMELSLENLAPGWTFSAPTGTGASFTTNITPTSTGTFNPELVLFNAEHGHNEVEGFFINVSVTQ